MSLEGTATGKTLVGSIQKCDVLTISAYGVAVQNGFEGTVEEWLASLKGEKGDKGDQGIQGVRGEKGEKGDTGKSAYEYAKDAGYGGTEAEFAEEVKNLPIATAEAYNAGNNANQAANNANAYIETAGEVLEEIRDIISSGEDAPAIICKKFGEVIAVSDASDRLLQGLRLYGKTTQSGTPSPSSPVPLVSAGDSGTIKITVCGGNLLPYPYKSTSATSGGLTYTVQEDGGIKVSGTKTTTSYFNLFGSIGDDYQTEKIRFTESVYVLLESGFSISARLTDGTYTEISGEKALNKPIGALYVNCSAAVNTAIDTVIYPMISYVNNTEYEPYKAQIITASTPNGLHSIGEVSDEIDFARGVAVKRVPCVNLAELAYSTNATQGLFHAILPHTAIKTEYDENTAPHLMCNTLPSLTRRACTSGTQGVTLSGDYIYLCVPECATVADLKTWFASHPTQVVYRPATILNETEPIPADELAAFAALHTNKPNTTVYTDSNAGIALEYIADTKTYIDSEIQTAIDGVEPGGGGSGGSGGGAAIPTKLPNPYALTFTGAVSATYDGSKSVSVEIPQGGSGGGGATEVVIAEVELTEETSAFDRSFSGLDYDELFFSIEITPTKDETKTTNTAMRVTINNGSGAIDLILLSHWDASNKTIPAYNATSNSKVDVFVKRIASTERSWWRFAKYMNGSTKVVLNNHEEKGTDATALYLSVWANGGIFGVGTKCKLIGRRYGA